jgi:hypothetical protein
MLTCHGKVKRAWVFRTLFIIYEYIPHAYLIYTHMYINGYGRILSYLSVL